jgi:hypothetical protein
MVTNEDGLLHSILDAISTPYINVGIPVDPHKPNTQIQAHAIHSPFSCSSNQSDLLVRLRPQSCHFQMSREYTQNAQCWFALLADVLT